ncbi:type III pantothenate kinase [Beggiatoa leptomitoformis]|uniref:Type III pantothenate kinase n=1 Tax=Beggiatoa leptomitoformis TaxID=288004 RepID=A0A2N9YFR1_9GAMM|nr:type III pantothenate kinase [Beggiatoa leptomitoformis]ALG68298.1 type III pantothenate kinase [Beggiatoa leptomitoformis]AUI69391.1 type III pantothenate kinase [Beggiatoa leptomitoformis]
MNLLIDIGNSCIKWASLEHHQLMTQQRCVYHKQNITTAFYQAWHTLNPPTAVWVSNVAGEEMAEALQQWTQHEWGLIPHFVKSTAMAQGVKNAYQHPEKLGVDRWLGLIGAHHLIMGNLCVVDCGTAITVDMINHEGQHLGGIIVPGVTTMHQALAKNANALAPYISLSSQLQSDKLATDTHEGITLGTLYAVLGLIDYVMNRFEPTLGTLSLVLTGGSLPSLLPLLQRPYQHIPDLVLQGLTMMVMQNK